MKKPFYLLFTPCNPIDVEPIDHGNILQPEYQSDRSATLEKRNKIFGAIGCAIGIGFAILCFVLSY